MDVGLILFGGLLTVLGGVLGAVILGHIENTREETRQKAAHRAAVRAVSLELASDVAGVEALVGVVYSLEEVGEVVTFAYDSSMLPLYDRLPDDTAMKVSLAYHLMRSTPGGPISLTGYAKYLKAASDSLRTYAEHDLDLRFPAQTLPDS